MMCYSPESRKRRAKFITNLDQKLYYANAFIQFLAIITKNKRASFDTLLLYRWQNKGKKVYEVVSIACWNIEKNNN